MPPLLSPHGAALRRWIDELRPLRVLFVAASGNGGETLGYLAERNAARSPWSASLPADHRPTLVQVSTDLLSAISPTAHYDLAVCPDLAASAPRRAQSLIARLRRTARFVAFTAPTAGANAWDDPAWKGFHPLALHDHGAEVSCLLRGGVEVEEEFDPGPRVWYLAPNRQMYGGVKILYNHVGVLRSLGIAAVLGTTDAVNWPAQWFPWNPAELHFGTEAQKTIRDCDTVVIPEFRYRDAADYSHAARRLLFVQNPGLAKGVRDWRRLGYDGVLTLGAPSGGRSFLQRHLEVVGCDLPVFGVPNHFDDDPWAEAVVERAPGQILCLPRKGASFVDRLEAEFGDRIHRVENKHQAEMAVEYAQADVYVHTGFPEGLGMPIVESMLAGCIACGFSGGGGLDVMCDGKTAFVAKDGDAEQLALVVRSALTAPNREAVRAAGNKAARQFTRASAAQALEECFRSWLPSLPRRRSVWWSKSTRCKSRSAEAARQKAL